MTNQWTPSQAAEELLARKRGREHLADYISYVSGLEPPKHARLLCDYLEQAMARKITRLMVFMPPGHAKSWCISRHFPAYYLAKYPKHAVIAATHTDDFAQTWGKRVRNLISSDRHKILFPNSAISEDSRASGRWETNEGGEYNAAGVGTNIAGRRSNLLLVDDPIPTAEAADSSTVRDAVYDWYGSDATPRLKKDAVIIVVSTRWSVDDLPGRLLAAQSQPGAEQWTVVSLPALAEDNDLLGRKPGEALWPEEYPAKRLLTIKAQPSTTARRWAALYQQNPIVEDGGIISRSWFRPWKYADPPKLQYTLQSWDTAASSGDTSAYSACTTWGIFDDENNVPAMILLSACRGRWVYPDLRKMVQRLAFDYTDDNLIDPKVSPAKRAPDMILIEDRSSGAQIIQEMMRAGVSVHRVNPQKFGNKDQRLMMATDFLENGRVYIPYVKPHFTMPRRFADELVTELVSYPAAASRDYADSFSQAVNRIKQLSLVRNTEDPIIDDIPRRAMFQPQAFY